VKEQHSEIARERQSDRARGLEIKGQRVKDGECEIVKERESERSRKSERVLKERAR